jgi:queuine tRNA-ribosyltransferase
MDVFGYALGGLAVGEPAAEMYEIIELVTPLLTSGKPRYLMGVGTPANLLESIRRGIDMFDCIMPTRNARNGMLFTFEGTVNIKNRKWATHHKPLDPAAPAGTNDANTYAYLHHLIHSDEILGLQIATLHNLIFYQRLMDAAGTHNISGEYTEWISRIIPQLNQRL